MGKSLPYGDQSNGRAVVVFGECDSDSAAIQLPDSDPAVLSIVRPEVWSAEDRVSEYAGSICEVYSVLAEIRRPLPRIPLEPNTIELYVHKVTTYFKSLG